MKKLSIFKKLAISSCSLLTFAPIILTATSCSKSQILTRYSTFFKFKDSLTAENNSWKMETGYFNDEELLTGTKRFCDGNYLLFVGSSEYETSGNFFGGKSGETASNINVWFDLLIKQSILHHDLLMANTLSISDDFGLVSFIEDFESLNHEVYDPDGRKIEVYDSDGKWIQKISPFLVWDDFSISQTKLKNKDKLPDDWDTECVTSGDYVRQDSQAKAFREFCFKGETMFPIITDARSSSFSTQDNASIGNIVLYKNGKLREIQPLPNVAETSYDSKEVDKLYGLINTYFIDSASDE